MRPKEKSCAPPAYVNTLADFQGATLGDVTIESSQITSKVLKVAIPESGANAAQQVVLDRVAAQAAEKGIRVVVIKVR